MAPLGTGDTGIANELLDALGDEDDYVRHVVIQSLRTVNNWNEASKSLRSESPGIRQGTRLALTGSFNEAAVAVLREFVLGAAGPASDDELVKAVEAVAEVHRRSEPYTKGWWGTQPAKGQPARPRKINWSGRLLHLKPGGALLTPPHYQFCERSPHPATINRFAAKQCRHSPHSRTKTRSACSRLSREMLTQMMHYDRKR